MLNQAMQDAINEQINKELYSAYLYLSMSAYFESINMPGSAKWMRAHHDEEHAHAIKFFDYVHDRGGRVVLKAIDQPTADFASPIAVWEAVLEHEKKVTGLIHRLYELAVKENDYASQVMLQWFINEQVEEEKNATQMVERFKAIGNQPAMLLLADGHLTKRGD
jgi:ferritin